MLIELRKQIKKSFSFEDEHLIFASNFTPVNVIEGKKHSITEWCFLLPYLNLDTEIVNTEWQILLEMVNSLKEIGVTLFWRKVAESKNGLGQAMFPNLM